MSVVFLARFDLSGAAELEADVRDALARTLDPDERARAARFVRDADRARFIVAHAELRRCLGLALDCAPEEVRFREGSGGKPELSPGSSGAQQLFFNLTHSPTVALVAWGDGPLGVDVEDLAGPRPADFYAAWTRKEALLKALGTGLSRDPATIDLIPPAEGKGVWSWADPQTGVSWVVKELDLGPAHRGALATTAPRHELVIVRATSNPRPSSTPPSC